MVFGHNILLVSKMTQGRACAHSHGTFLSRGGIFSIKLKQYINIILFFTGVWLLYNVVLVSAAQQSKSAIGIAALCARLTGRNSELASLPWGLPGGAVCLPGDTRDTSTIPGAGRYPGEGNGKPVWYSCLGKTPWTEEPGGLQTRGLQRVGND